MTAMTLEATHDMAIPVPKMVSARPSSLSCALDLSKSRANDAALDILRAYKLTGNFHANLEIVLKDIGAFDKVTYQVELNSKLFYLLDCRHVVFTPNQNVPNDVFDEIIKSIGAGSGLMRLGGSSRLAGSSQNNVVRYLRVNGNVIAPAMGTWARARPGTDGAHGCGQRWWRCH